MDDDSAGPREPLPAPREQEVIKLIAEAHTNREIGAILHLADKTVESHRANILRKLGYARPRGTGALRDQAGVGGAVGVSGCRFVRVAFAGLRGVQLHHRGKGVRVRARALAVVLRRELLRFVSGFRIQTEAVREPPAPGADPGRPDRRYSLPSMRQ